MKKKTYILLRNLNRPSGIILGISSLTGLSIVRSLGIMKIPVIGVDISKFALGRFSRYCSSTEVCDTDEELLSFLRKVGKASKHKNVIICESDRYIQFIDKYKEEIQKYFYLTASSTTPLSEIMNKGKMIRLAKSAGLDVPLTFFSEENSMTKIKNSILYPCFIKPIYSQTWLRKKGEIVKNAQELEMMIGSERFKNGYLIQEIIEGPETNLWLYFGYVSKNIKIGFTCYKIRQIPKDFGVATIAIGMRNKEIEKLGDGFLNHIQYNGLFGIEFKKDLKDGKYKFVESNFRIIAVNELLVAMGINLSYFAYLNALNLTINHSVEYKDGIKWVSITDDFITCFKYYSKTNKFILLDWLKTIFEADSYADFRFLDIGPFIFKVFYHLGFLRNEGKIQKIC